MNDVHAEHFGAVSFVLDLFALNTTVLPDSDGIGM